MQQLSVRRSAQAVAGARPCAVSIASPVRSVRAGKAARNVQVFASDVNPVRAAISNVVSQVYKIQGMTSAPESGLSPLWQAIKRMDLAGVSSALSSGADANERDANGDTALLYIARAGHYKYPPAEIPAKLIQAGADIEARDSKGLTALQISLLSGWQNISELLIRNGASTAGVAEIKGRLTCPDCRRVVAKYNL